MRPRYFDARVMAEARSRACLTSSILLSARSLDPACFSCSLFNAWRARRREMNEPKPSHATDAGGAQMTACKPTERPTGRRPGCLPSRPPVHLLWSVDPPERERARRPRHCTGRDNTASKVLAPEKETFCPSKSLGRIGDGPLSNGGSCHKIRKVIKNEYY